MSQDHFCRPWLPFVPRCRTGPQCAAPRRRVIYDAGTLSVRRRGSRRHRVEKKKKIKKNFPSAWRSCYYSVVVGAYRWPSARARSRPPVRSFGEPPPLPARVVKCLITQRRGTRDALQKANGRVVKPRRRARTTRRVPTPASCNCLVHARARVPVVW